MPVTYDKRRRRTRLILELDSPLVRDELKVLAAKQRKDLRTLVLAALKNTYPQLAAAVDQELPPLVDLSPQLSPTSPKSGFDLGGDL